MSSTQSTITLQNEVDAAQLFGDLEPVLTVGGSSAGPALRAANDVMNAICAVPFPWKWNELQFPAFYTNSYQQDYAVINADGSSITNLSWLERGVAFDINNSAIPKPFVNVEVGRQLPERTGTYINAGPGIGQFIANFFPNNMLYFGTWGSANVGGGTLGNNPVSGSTYTSPLGATSHPANPITQIQDANGNLLLLTGYGTEGTTAPVAPANSAAGTVATPGVGATTVWKVVDPNGVGFRILPVPSQTGVVWQFNIVGQKKPVRFSNLRQTLDPLTDEMEPHFFQGFIAQLYRYSPEAKVRAKFAPEWQLWLKSLNDLRVKEDRELEENSFVPDRGIMGTGRSRNTYRGAAWPFNYPSN